MRRDRAAGPGPVPFCRDRFQRADLVRVGGAFAGGLDAGGKGLPCAGKESVARQG